MTGFGRGEAATPTLAVTVDVRTVNHRHLDIDLRGSLLAPELGSKLRRAVSERLSRGKVEVLVSLRAREARAASVRVDHAAVVGMVEALQEVARELDLAEPVTLAHVAALPWQRALESASPELAPSENDAIAAALDDALERTVEMRRQEGRMVVDDLVARLERLEALQERVRVATTDAPQRQLERLRERMRQLMGEAGVSEERLLQEAAFLADKADVAEELTRLRLHLDALRRLLDAEGAVGKRLDFTLQEAFREVNTIGSKSRDVAITEDVIEMKSELERMREQAANVE